jgi:uncharacterized protein YukE
MCVRFGLLILLFVLYGTINSGATDFDDCAMAAGHLKDASGEADSAKQHFDSVKDDYESACGSYGYDRNNQYACGRYGYHYTELEDAKSQLEHAISEVRDAHERTNNSCEGDYSRRSAVMRFAQKLNLENQELRAKLSSCQGKPNDTAPSRSGK